MDGRVKYCCSNGYGFIETAQRIDYYFHHSQFNGNWKHLLRRYVSDEMLIVEFENDPEGTDGPRAKNVKLKDSNKVV